MTGAPAQSVRSGTGTQSKLVVRPTTPADLEAVVSLLSERDGHALSAAHVSSALFGLDPAHLAGWIAFADGVPVGLTTLYLRDERFGEKTCRAGYWAHLFVREPYRKLLVYPQLVMAMMRGTKSLGYEAIFTGTRRAHVAEGHVKLGFAKIGELGVLFKPLRPFRLVARYKNWPGFVQSAAGPGDGLYGAFLGVRRPGVPSGVSIRVADHGDATLSALAVLLNEAGGGKSAEVWTVDSLRRRLGTAIDGRDYSVVLAERGRGVVGAGVYRVAVRERVSVGVIMELVTAPGEPVAAGLLAFVESQLKRAGADTTLFLDGLGPEMSKLLGGAGHRTAKETYQMLVWPKALVPATSAAANLANWRFSFLDHDAF